MTQNATDHYVRTHGGALKLNAWKHCLKPDKNVETIAQLKALAAFSD